VALASGVANADLYCAGYPQPCGPVLDGVCDGINTPDCGTSQGFPCCLRGFNYAFSDVMYQNFQLFTDSATVTIPTTGAIVVEEYQGGELMAQNMFSVSVPNMLMTINLSEQAPNGDFFRLYVGQTTGATASKSSAYAPSMSHMLTPSEGAGSAAVQQVIRLYPDQLGTVSPPKP
jgi:hypothetical protein